MGEKGKEGGRGGMGKEGMGKVRIMAFGEMDATIGGL